MANILHIARSSNGRTHGFGPWYRGSSPCRAATSKLTASVAFRDNKDSPQWVSLCYNYLMLFMRHSKHKTLLVSILGTLLVIGLTALYWERSESIKNQTEWANYSVNVPAFTDDLRGEYFTFQYPKSEYIQLSPDHEGRLLRFQNYDPNTTSRTLDGRYNLEFFIDTKGHITCGQNVANAEMITNSQGVTMQKGQARQSEESGSGAVGIAACIERQGYILYIQGSDNTGEGIVEHMIDTVHYSN